MGLNVHRPRAIDIHPPFTCIRLISADLASRSHRDLLVTSIVAWRRFVVRASAAGVAAGRRERCVRIRCDRACAGPATSAAGARPAPPTPSASPAPAHGRAARRRRADRQRRDRDRHRHRDPQQRILRRSRSRTTSISTTSCRPRRTPRSASPSTTPPRLTSRPNAQDHHRQLRL